MSEANSSILEQASVRRSRRVSVFWAIPVVAVAIGAWLAWDTLSRQGPTIVVSFQDAEGLEPGHSQLKFKDIVLGTVKSLDLTPDRRNVLVTIATTAQATPMLTGGTEFWVVKPRLFAGNISGLGTLLSGAYVGMMPGAAAAKAANRFVGREEPPVLQSDVPGRTFLLKTTELGSVTLGSPVFYRGLSVGQVLGWDIGAMAESVTIHVFVRTPFDSYVRDQTRFWNASGVSVKIGGAGVEVQVESLRALLLGGVAFETPVDGAVAEVSAENHLFPLFANQEAARSASYSRKIPLLTYFAGSIRGLVPGSDVVMHGMKVGRVLDTRLVFDPATDAVLAPVHFEVEPERVVGIGRPVVENLPEVLQAMVRKGLRASLQSGNLLTGEMMISLEIVPDAPPETVVMEGSSFVIPRTESGGFSGLQASASELLRNVNAIPIASIGRNLNEFTAGINEIANGTQLKNALKSLAATLSDAQTLMQQLDTDAGPAVKRLPEIASALQATLRQSNQLMQSVQAGYGDNTQFHRDLDRLLAQVNDAARSFRALADLLARHPEALVRGRPGAGTP